MSRRIVLFLSVIIFAASAVLCLGSPQGTQKPPEQPPARGGGPPGEIVTGTLASVGVDHIEIKSADGTSHTVLVNDQTRYRQGQQDIQLEDLKPGDRVFARGPVNDKKQFVAAMVRRVTDEEMQRFQGAGAGERLGGEILSINGNELKVRTRMQGDKVVVVNDQTTFMKEGQPITLKDVKVGDRIFATGKETDGKFVAERVMTGQIPRRRTQ